MKYKLLNEVLIEWNESSKEDSDNIILNQKDINKSLKGVPTEFLGKDQPKGPRTLAKLLKDVFNVYGPGTKESPINLNWIDISKLDILNYKKYVGDTGLHLTKGVFEDINFNYIDISKWNVSKITSFSELFNDCDQLVSVGDLSKWNPVSGVSFQSMFDGCVNLKYIGNISSWKISENNKLDKTAFEKMFAYCQSLNNIGNIGDYWPILKNLKAEWKTYNQGNFDRPARFFGFLYGCPAEKNLWK